MRKQMCEKPVKRKCPIFTGDQMHEAGRDHKLVRGGDAQMAHIPSANELRFVGYDAGIKYYDNVWTVSRFVLLIQLKAMFGELFEADIRSEAENYPECACRSQRALRCLLTHLADWALSQPLDLFDDCGDSICRDDLVRAIIFVNGTRLLIVDNHVLMIAHLVVGIDHEPFRRVEALWKVTVQELPYLFLCFATLLPRMGD